MEKRESSTSAGIWFVFYRIEEHSAEQKIDSRKTNLRLHDLIFLRCGGAFIAKALGELNFILTTSFFEFFEEYLSVLRR